MSKEIILNDEARAALKRGVDKVANVVKLTLGPKGRNVAISNGYGMPFLTKDGVTVAKSIDLKDPIENVGAQLLKQAAMRSNDLVGDGTTTATILAQSMISEGFRLVNNGANPLALKRGMEEAKDAIVEELLKMAIPVTEADIERVASISANDPVIGKIVADVANKVGLKGVITVTEGRSAKVETEVVQGMRMDRGFVSPYMPDSLEEPYVFVTDKRLSKADDVVPIIQKGLEAGRKNFLFVCDDLDGEALAVCIINKMKGNFNVIACKAPGYADRRTDLLGDIAALVGATLVSSAAGRVLSDVSVQDLGTCERVVSTKDHTTIIGGRGDVSGRISDVETLIEEASSDFDSSKLKERLAGLTGGVGVIRVGAATEVEMKELKHRIEDAVAATKAAQEEGVVPGGGVALLRASTGMNTLMVHSLDVPLRTLAENAGSFPDLVVSAVRGLTGNIGWNAESGQYEDMISAGIIDPCKVVRMALENAVSVASLLLTTECILVEETPPTP